jgi:hypothetical protein
VAVLVTGVQTCALPISKKGLLRPHYSIKLNNSMGTNKKALSALDVADIIIVPTKNGVFALDRATVLANHTLLGDGVSVKVTGSEIIPITGPITQHKAYATNLKQSIMAAITQALP